LRSCDLSTSLIFPTGFFEGDHQATPTCPGHDVCNASSDRFSSANLVSNNGAAPGDGIWLESDLTFLEGHAVQRNAGQLPEFFWIPSTNRPEALFLVRR
jgi:hypothetical protein